METIKVLATSETKRESLGNGTPTPTIKEGNAYLQTGKHLLIVEGIDSEKDYEYGTYGAYVRALLDGVPCADGYQQPSDNLSMLMALGLSRQASKYYLACQEDGVYFSTWQSKEELTQKVVNLKNFGLTETEVQRILGVCKGVVQAVYRPNYTITLQKTLENTVIKIMMQFQSSEERDNFKSKYPDFESLAKGAKRSKIKLSDFVAPLGGTVTTEKAKSIEGVSLADLV